MIRSFLSHDPDWTGGGAACLDQYDLFAPAEDKPHTKDDRAAALAICAACPMLVECREWAAKTRPTSGVVGGVDLSNPWASAAR